MTTRPTILLLASSIVSAVACSQGGGGSLDDADAGTLGNDGGNRSGSDGGSDAKSPDGAILTKSDGGTWGPCPLATVGHAQAEAVTPRSLFTLGCPSSTTTGSFALVNSPSEYEALRGDAGPDAGPTPSVDWSTESVVVITYAYGGEAYTFGREGTVLVASVGKTCSGVAAPPCQRDVVAVPKVSTTTSVSCPLPNEPCQAP